VKYQEKDYVQSLPHVKPDCTAELPYCRTLHLLAAFMQLTLLMLLAG